MSTAVDRKHPSVTEMEPEWQLARDAYDGDPAIKARREEYLPPTGTMIADGFLAGDQDALALYAKYLGFACYPDVVTGAVDVLLGTMHEQPASIRLPKALEPMREDASADGESLQAVLMRINEQQLQVGGCGMLADLPAQRTPGALPHIALFDRERLGNFDEGSSADPDRQVLRMVTINESDLALQADGFSWNVERRYRVLRLDPATGVYTFELIGSDGIRVEGDKGAGVPTFESRTASEIPFEFINVTDRKARPQRPPLQTLAREGLHINRMTADYHQHLHMSGQDTLVVVGTQAAGSVPDTGGGATFKTGVGHVVHLNEGGDANYRGITGIGLPEQREALVNAKRDAYVRGAQMLTTMTRQAESGEALAIRKGAATANLTRVARTGAEGLTSMLRKLARWRGLPDADVEECRVVPFTGFAQRHMDLLDLVQLIQAKNAGFVPITWESIHMQLKTIGGTEKPYETEIDGIREEDSELEDITGSGPTVPAEFLN